eukprot:c35833_g1_i1 orf=44-319(-)
MNTNYAEKEAWTHNSSEIEPKSPILPSIRLSPLLYTAAFTVCFMSTLRKSCLPFDECKTFLTFLPHLTTNGIVHSKDYIASSWYLPFSLRQ